MAIRKDIFSGVRGEIRRDEPLSNHTTFKIGGNARFFIEPEDEADLAEVLARARSRRMPVFLLGAGSNILVGDKGVRGIVVHLSRRHFTRIAADGTALTAGSGAFLARVIRSAALKGLGGIEFLAGIPGTLGGALAMNAGAWGKSIADSVEIVRVMDYNGSVRELTREQCGFGYRSGAAGHAIILGARLRLAGAARAAIESRARECAARKRAAQDYSHPSAGCVFKNPDGDSAGRLLDECGLKGYSIGGAQVSQRHANFIVNTGGARSSDVMKLMGVMKRSVKRLHDIVLQPEIQQW